MEERKIEFTEKLFPTVIYGFDGAGNDKYMEIDAAVLEDHAASVRFTEHPVEFGAKISDHGIIQPRTYTLSGRVATISMSDARSAKTGPYSPAFGDVLRGSLNRPPLAWEKLQDLMFARNIVTVESNLKVYENLVLESISTEQNWQTSRVLDFEATFRELFVVKAPRINVDPNDTSPEEEEPEPAESVFYDASPEVDAGEQALTLQTTFDTNNAFISRNEVFQVESP